MRTMKPVTATFLQLGLLTLTAVVQINSAICAAGSPAQDSRKKPGFYTDDFRILPEVEATVYYDNNIYATKRLKEADWVALISPRLGVDSLWESHSLELDGGADFGRFTDNGSEDYDDYWLNGNAEFEISTDRQLYSSASYNHNHENRGSKEGGSLQIDEPTTYDLIDAQAGVNQKFDLTSIKAGLTYKQLDYDNVGSLYNDDRDRTESGFGVRLSYGLPSRSEIYTQAILNRRDYGDRQDQFGYNRDSKGSNLIIGASRRYGKGNKLDAYLGQINQDYDDSRFDSVNLLIYGLDLRWYPSNKTKITAKVERTQNETTEVGASSYLYTYVDLQIDQKLGKDILGYVNVNRGVADFQDVGREDVSQSLGIGLKYYLNPLVMFSSSYSYIDNDSNDTNRVYGVSESYDYKRGVIFFTVRARLVP
ncbi:MAG: outer membrane beta-barrel protein [Candidatus Thiodiazotropha sp. 6PLUC2]